MKHRGNASVFPSPPWRRVGYMTCGQAGAAYWFFQALCAVECRIGRKIF